MDKKPEPEEPKEIDIWRFNKHKTTTKYPYDHLMNQLYRCMVTLRKFQVKTETFQWTNKGQVRLEITNF